VIRHGTFAETNGNGRDAPIPAVAPASIELVKSTFETPHDCAARRAAPSQSRRSDRVRPGGNDLRLKDRAPVPRLVILGWGGASVPVQPIGGKLDPIFAVDIAVQD
jgi:hypothetical protein